MMFKLPTTIATAMATDRTEFIKLATADDLDTEDVRKLLCALVEDRRRSRMCVEDVISYLRNARGVVDKASATAEAALKHLKGEG